MPSSVTLAVRERAPVASVVRATHTVSSLADAHGGPSRSVTRLCDALTATGVLTEIVVSQSEGEEILPLEPSVVVRRVTPPRWPTTLGRPSAFGDAITETRAPGATVIHDHGLWLPTNVVAAAASQRVGAPLVVSLKGMTAPRALGHRRVKKTLAWWAYQRRALKAASAFHVTSEDEGDSVRRLGLRQPLAVIPYGIEEPPDAPDEGRPEGPRRALFLSRLHPIKGLPLLIEAWARVRPDGWELVIAGPDEGGHRGELERLVRRVGLGNVIQFAGPVGDVDKWALYRTASLFALPTYSENFGIVVAEALAAGVPVLTTRGAPWGALERERCGWWTDVSVAGVAAALATATGLTDGELREAGERGRRYVRRELSWSRAAVQTRALYEWLLGFRERPDCVVQA